MDTYDTVIVGSGVAGMTCALYLARAGHRVMLLGDRSMSSLAYAGTVENYPGTPPCEGLDLLDRLSESLEGTVDRLEHNAVGVDVIERGVFDVRTPDRSIRGLNVVIATGSAPLIPNIEGIGDLVGRGVSTCAHCDGDLYRGKRVVVIGSGNHAVGDALYLSNVASSVDVCCRGRRLKATEKVGELARRENVTIRFNTQFDYIERHLGEILLRDTQSEFHRYDGVFLSTGMVPRSEIVSSLVQRNRQGYILTSDSETSISYMFACGDVNASNTFKQAVTAAADGAYCAHSVIRRLEMREPLVSSGE